MDFRILGPVEALDGEHLIALAGPKQRALLARLAERPRGSAGRHRLPIVTADAAEGMSTQSAIAERSTASLGRFRMDIAETASPHPPSA
jgi:hypothetical protein